MSALPPKADIDQHPPRRPIPDPSPLFADGCTVIACYRNAKPADTHLAFHHALTTEGGAETS
jgi:hypothetical protein